MIVIIEFNIEKMELYISILNKEKGELNLLKVEGMYRQFNNTSIIIVFFISFTI